MSHSSIFAVTAATLSAVVALSWVFRNRNRSCSCKCSSCLCQRKDGREWFAELSDEMWPGQSMCLSIKKVLYKGKSKYQDVCVFESETFGTVLTLDGVIQVTTRDEHAYQETMAHTPMHLVKHPKRALVIGGGDGGVLRELAKYKSLEEIHICELDEVVIDVSRKFIPQTACGYDDPRVRVHVEDGFSYLDRVSKEGVLFDVIVSDLSDPVGPAEAIFTENFIHLVHRCLSTTGAASLQGESMWLHRPLIAKLLASAKSTFADAKYASISIPTYPCGQIGSLIMTKDASIKVDQPLDIADFDNKHAKNLKYYTKAVHKAQFVLPKFVAEDIE